ncbi:MAG: hypothetical protein ABSD52_04940 [Candidatus Cybelea sp.]
MRHSVAAALALAGLFLAACSASPPASDDDVLKHVLAINTCNAKMYVKQARAALRPGPTPSYDDRGLRLCFVATVPDQTLNQKIKRHPAILALGRSCEKLINTQSDAAMAAYQKCIQDGMLEALKGP